MSDVGTIAANDPQMKDLAKQLRILKEKPDLINTTISQINTLIATDQATIAANTAQVDNLNIQIAARTNALVAAGATSADIVADPQALALGAQITGYLAANDSLGRHVAQMQTMIAAQNAELAALPAQEAAVAALLAARLDQIRGI